MPQRFLRPGLTTSQRFNSASWHAQIFYVRILTLVDDFGRYDAEPRLLRSHAFPFGDPTGKEIPVKTVENICKQLSVNALIAFYQDKDGKKYLQVLRWQERPRAEKSKYPPLDNTCEQMFANDSKCSLPSPSSSPLPLHPRQRHNGSVEPATLQEWLEELKKDETYKGIDVKREFGKMSNWCKTHRVNATRRRFVNWLNRVDRPIANDKPKTLDKSQINVASEFLAWAAHQYPAKSDEIKKWKTWAEVPPHLRAEWWRETKSHLTDVLTA